MNMQIRGGMQITLAKKLKRVGVDVQSCFVDGDHAACARAIRAVAEAERALERPSPRGSEPSDERRTKGRLIEGVTVHPDQPKAHQVVWPIDEMRRHKLLTDAEYEAAHRYRAQHEILHKSVGVANWDGAGGATFGPRMGLTERQQMAGADLARANAALGQATIRAAAINFILEIPAPGNASVLGWSDFAKTQIAVADVVGGRWLSYAYTHSACQKLAAVYDAIDAESRVLRRIRA